MVEEGIIEENIMLFIDMQKLIANALKIMIKLRNLHILNIEMYIIYMDGQCPKSYL